MKIIAWFLLFFSLASASTAQTLKFVFSDFPPFEYLDNGTAAGINKEIIEKACQRLGINPVFVQLPWKRALDDARDGDADAIFSLFTNPERTRHYSFPQENLNMVRMVLLTGQDNPMEVHRLEDLLGKTVGVYLGSSYGKTFDAADWIIREPAPTNRSLLRKQRLGRTDLVVMDARVAAYWCHKLGMQSEFRMLDYVITETPTYVAFSKAREAKTGNHWAGRFSEVLKTMKAEGVMEAINQQYNR